MIDRTDPDRRMSGEELKPADCPFCGSDEVGLVGGGVIQCAFCGAEGPTIGNDPVEAWNRRHPLPEQPREGWRTMDSAPKDRCILLASLAVANAGQGPEWAITAGYWDAEFEWDNDEHRGAWTDDTVASWGYQERVELSPSRWMPLPTPPSTETKESGE